MRLRPLLAIAAVLSACLLPGCGKDKADLDGTAITGTPVNPQPGSTVMVTATVKNTGDKKAGRFAWTVNRDGAYGYAGGTVDGLAKGASTTVSFPVTEAAAGSHTFEVIFNSGNAFSEGDFGNNSISMGITFALPFDLSVAPLVVDPTAPTTLTPITVTATVTNSSASTGTATGVAWRVQRDGVDSYASGTLDTLAPGASVAVPFTVPVETAGSHTYQFTVDPDHVSTDTDAANDSQSTTVAVAAGAAAG